MIPRRGLRPLALSSALVASAALTAVTPAQLAVGAVSAGAVARSTPVTTVKVNPKAKPNGTLPVRYIGFAYPSTDINDGHFVNAGDYPALLENFGPGVLRFGGGGADSPAYAGATPSTRKGLAALTRVTGWKVLYTVNMGSFRAAAVTADAHRMAAALGSRLLAVSCGNEPELWSRAKYRPAGYNERAYLRDLPGCVRAVHTGAPKARIAGPDIYQPAWLPSYASAAGAGKVRGLAWLAAHFYPTTHCHSGAKGAATLLSRATAAREATRVSDIAAAARTAHVRFLMDETNSASCGGVPGVANTYASALWVADWLMIGAEHGAQGMYLNGYLNHNCSGYTPLCEVSGADYAPQPIYYGMLLAHLMGSGHTLPTRVGSSAGALDIVAHAVRGPRRQIRVMVENLNPTATTVVLRVAGASGWAALWRLTGPRLSATSGIRIQGAQVASSGHFFAKAGHVKCRGGACRITLRAYSSIVVRVP